MVETSLYARQCLLVEPRGDPDPLVQALLPEAGVLEEPGGVQEPRAGLLARIQPPLRPSHRMDMDEPEDATMVRQARPEFIARVVSGDTRMGKNVFARAYARDEMTSQAVSMPISWCDCSVDVSE